MKKLLSGRLPCALLSILLCAVVLSASAVFTGCGEDGQDYVPTYITGDEVDADAADDGVGADDAADEDSVLHEGLVIPLSQLGTSAKFFGTTVDGTYMEVVAFKYGASYRTAFNTCQVCYGSRTAYFLQTGNYLQCQNCKSKFALSNVGVKISSYSCSPYPILETDRTQTDDSIIISYEFLLSCKNYFKTWKIV